VNRVERAYIHTVVRGRVSTYCVRLAVVHVCERVGGSIDAVTAQDGWCSRFKFRTCASQDGNGDMLGLTVEATHLHGR